MCSKTFIGIKCKAKTYGLGIVPTASYVGFSLALYSKTTYGNFLTSYNYSNLMGWLFTSNLPLHISLQLVPTLI